MNVATKRQPGAGQGNGSVLTQNQPTCSWPSSVQSSSASSGIASTIPALPGWISSRLTCAKVATPSRWSLAVKQKRERAAHHGRSHGNPRHVVADDAAVEATEDVDRRRQRPPADDRDDAGQPPPVQAEEGKSEREDRRTPAVEQRLQGGVADRYRQARRRGERGAVEDTRRRGASGLEPVRGGLRPPAGPRHDADRDAEENRRERHRHEQRPENGPLPRDLLPRGAEQ